MFKLNSLLILSLCLLAGCGGGVSDPELGLVEGILTVDGKPVKEAKIYFYPVGKGSTSEGTTDDSGHFSLTYRGVKPGAIVGKHQVVATTEISPVIGDSGKIEKPGRNQEIPSAYTSRSEYKVDVVPGKNEIKLDFKSR